MASSANYDTHSRTIFSSCYFMPLCFSRFLSPVQTPFFTLCFQTPSVQASVLSQQWQIFSFDFLFCFIYKICFLCNTWPSGSPVDDCAVASLSFRTQAILQQLLRCPAYTRNWNEDLWGWNNDLCVETVGDIRRIRGNLGVSYLVIFHLFYATNCCAPDHL
jgi:hypothetical protein